MNGEAGWLRSLGRDTFIGHSGGMAMSSQASGSPYGTGVPGHASASGFLDAAITEDQRTRTEDFLKGAYVHGRMGSDEFNRRIDLALRARTRRELNASLAGFSRAGVASRAVDQLGAYPSVVVPQVVRTRASRGAAAAAHWSGAFSWILGPAAVYALSKPHSYPRREAAKAFNTQIVMAIISGVVIGLSVGFGLGWIPFALWSGLALVTIVVSGLHAIDGQERQNPVHRVLPLRILDEN